MKITASCSHSQYNMTINGRDLSLLEIANSSKQLVSISTTGQQKLVSDKMDNSKKMAGDWY